MFGELQDPDCYKTVEEDVYDWVEYKMKLKKVYLANN